MTPVSEAVNAAEHRRYRPQARAACNQEHHEDLVFNRLGRGNAAQNLPRHHAGKRNQAGYGHRIDGGHQRATAAASRSAAAIAATAGTSAKFCWTICSLSADDPAASAGCAPIISSLDPRSSSSTDWPRKMRKYGRAVAEIEVEAVVVGMLDRTLMPVLSVSRKRPPDSCRPALRKPPIPPLLPSRRFAAPRHLPPSTKLEREVTTARPQAALVAA